MLESYTTNNSAFTRASVKISKTQEQKKNNKLTSKLTVYHLTNNENQVLIEAKNYFKFLHLLSPKSFSNQFNKFNNLITFKRMFAHLTMIGNLKI